MITFRFTSAQFYVVNALLTAIGGIGLITALAVLGGLLGLMVVAIVLLVAALPVLARIYWAAIDPEESDDKVTAAADDFWASP